MLLFVDNNGRIQSIYPRSKGDPKNPTYIETKKRKVVGDTQTFVPKSSGDQFTLDEIVEREKENGFVMYEKTSRTSERRININIRGTKSYTKKPMPTTPLLPSTIEPESESSESEQEQSPLGTKPDDTDTQQTSTLVPPTPSTGVQQQETDDDASVKISEQLQDVEQQLETIDENEAEQSEETQTNLENRNVNEDLLVPHGGSSSEAPSQFMVRTPESGQASIDATPPTAPSNTGRFVVGIDHDDSIAVNLEESFRTPGAKRDTRRKPLTPEESLAKNINEVDQSSMSTMMKERTKQSLRMEYRESVQVSLNTNANREETNTNMQTAEQLLSESQLRPMATPRNARTGHDASMATSAPAGQVSATINTQTDEAREQNQATDPSGRAKFGLRDSDRNIPGLNQTGTTLLSSRDTRTGDFLEQGHGFSSANQQEASEARVEHVDPKDQIGQEDRTQNEVRRAELENTRENLIEAQQEQLSNDQLQQVIANTMRDPIKQEQMALALDRAPQASEDDLIQLDMYENLRQINASGDLLQSDEAGAVESAAQDEAAQQTSMESSFTPIPRAFSPSSSRLAFATLQRAAVQEMSKDPVKTQRRRRELRSKFETFKTIQVTEGVREMMQMPSILITSPHSTLRAASLVRPDITQEHSTMGTFLFWLLRQETDTLDAAHWDRFIEYTAATGMGELTPAQINFLITGNIEGNLSDSVKFNNPSYTAVNKPLSSGPQARSGKFLVGDIESLDAQIKGSPTPTTQFPASNISPRSLPSDKSVHPDGSNASQRIGQKDLSGVPSMVHNIPDPRYSRRGGQLVPNLRYVTVKNKKYNPKDPRSKQFITKAVDDVGAGSKDPEHDINIANADRLLKGKPQKLYAPIHAIASDRYLGSRNYQRLSIGIVKYLETYSKQGFTAKDTMKMYKWNQFAMRLYGPSLYAFSGIEPRTTPVFSPRQSNGVKDEFMELNELITEVSRYQKASTDRADRVDGAGKDERPLEKSLTNFFDKKDVEDKQKLIDANAVVLSLPGGGPVTPSGSGDDPDDHPGLLPDKPVTGIDDAGQVGFASGPGVQGAFDMPIPDDSTVPFSVHSVSREGTDTPSTPSPVQHQNESGLVIKDTSQFRIGPKEIDHGIRRNVYHPTINNPDVGNARFPMAGEKRSLDASTTMPSNSKRMRSTGDIPIDANRRMSMFNRLNRR